MSSWTSGYVADIGYTFGFYRELTPAMLALAALSAGQRPPDINGPLNYCELGCGQGFTANIVAAANAHMQVYATDFNPSHIVGAQSLAQQGGSAGLNIKFSESSFQEYIDDPELPSFDIIVLHGIYSWVSPENRKAIVAFLRRKLKPGGLVYASYNAMPGWAPAAPMRHLMYLYGQNLPGSTGDKLEPALKLVEQMQNVGAKYFVTNPSLAQKFDRMKAMPKSYLAHEYLNDAWTLLYHNEVADEFSEAKLSYLTSAHMLDHLDSINLTPGQLKLLSETPDRSLRETLRDFIVNQQFRRDLFVKGGLTMSMQEVRERWLESRFALTTWRSDVALKVNGHLGEATLQADIYNPILDMLATGPKTFSQLLGETNRSDTDFARLREALVALVGSGHLQPCLDAKNQSKRAARTKSFNSALMERAISSSDLLNLASPVTGGGVAISRFAQVFLLARQRKHPNPVQLAWEGLVAQNQLILKDGEPLKTAEENIAYLEGLYKDFLKQLPLLEQLGIA